MSNYEELKNANRRWTILKLLADDLGHQIEARLMQRALAVTNVSHDVALDKIRRDFLWLEKRMCIELNIDGDLVHAALLTRGADLAAGRDRLDGVDEPPLN